MIFFYNSTNEVSASVTGYHTFLTTHVQYNKESSNIRHSKRPTGVLPSL